MSKSTLSYALASQPLISLVFSGTTGTSSQYLAAAGGIAGDGVPIPFSGSLYKLTVFDGTTVYTESDVITFNANDRISVYCQNVGGSFSVKIRINGSSSAMQVVSVPLNSTLQVSLFLALNRTEG
jgi:hypothetical protein